MSPCGVSARARNWIAKDPQEPSVTLSLLPVSPHVLHRIAHPASEVSFVHEEERELVRSEHLPDLSLIPDPLGEDLLIDAENLVRFRLQITRALFVSGHFLDVVQHR